MSRWRLLSGTHYASLLLHALNADTTIFLLHWTSSGLLCTCSAWHWDCCLSLHQDDPVLHIVMPTCSQNGCREDNNCVQNNMNQWGFVNGHILSVITVQTIGELLMPMQMLLLPGSSSQNYTMPAMFGACCLSALSMPTQVL